MRKRVKQLPSWRVVRLKKTPAVPIGIIQARDAASAIQEAIKRYGIVDPIQQARLAAYRWP